MCRDLPRLGSAVHRSKVTHAKKNKYETKAAVSIAETPHINLVAQAMS